MDIQSDEGRVPGLDDENVTGSGFEFLPVHGPETSSYGWRWGPGPRPGRALSRNTETFTPYHCGRKDVYRLGVLGHPIEKVDHARLQTVLGANDQQPVIRNETLQNGRPMPQMVGRGPDVGADGVRDKGLGVLCEGCGQQGLDRGSDPVDDRAEVGRLLERRLAQLLQRSEERRVGKECRSRWSPYH